MSDEWSETTASCLTSGQERLKLEIPEPLRLREAAICAALREAAGTGGKTAEAAELLEAILLPHLARERADMLQPLGLLAPLVRGTFSPEMAEVLPQIDRLKSDLHDLRIEHATILSAIKRFVAAARAEGKAPHARFAERLLFRAWLDESVFGPLAILIGKYLRLRLQRTPISEPESGSARGRIEFQIPESLRLSHAELSAALFGAARAGGQTGRAAEAVARILETHLQTEDQEVLRVLGLLELLATGSADLETSPDLAQLDHLELSESALSLQHSALIAAAEKLLASARQEGAEEVLEFAERLLLRIRLDEEVFYPAALLVRNYLRLRRRPRGYQGVTST